MRRVLILGLFVPILCAQSTAPRPSPTVLVFADITGSIPQDEIEEVRRLVVKTINSSLLNSRVLIYPINSRAELPRPLFQVAKMKAPLTEKETTELMRLLKDAYDREGTTGRSEPRSCVIRALAFAASQVREQRAPRGRIDVIVISDMIEECKVAEPLGRSVNFMSTPDAITREKEKLKSTAKPATLDFKDARITIVVPPRGSSTKKRPDPLRLEVYWRAFFEFIQIQEDHYHWLSGKTATILTIPR